MPDEIQKRDVYKNLICKLCDTLIDRRSSPKYENRNIAMPITIPLKELEGVLEYAGASRQTLRIRELKKALVQLNEDFVSEKDTLTVITIKNLSILDSFSDNYNANKKITIRCSTEGLKAYKEKLIDLTQEYDFPAPTTNNKKAVNIKIEGDYLVLGTDKIPAGGGQKAMAKLFLDNAEIYKNNVCRKKGKTLGVDALKTEGGYKTEGAFRDALKTLRAKFKDHKWPVRIKNTRREKLYQMIIRYKNNKTRDQ